MSVVFRHPTACIDAVTLVSDGTALRALYFAGGKYGEPPEPTGEPDAIIDRARSQLDAYFAGKRKSFDLPLAPQGTPFQMRVWAELQKIPYGTAISYSDLAAAIGAPKAVRAVGSANGRNPIPVIIPCHRVIAADGTLGGFGGGLPRKVALLELERETPDLFR